MKLREQGVIQKDEKVVVVSTAHGLKFTESKAQYHTGELKELSCRYKNNLQVLPDDPNAVIDAIKKRFD
jgi:threonine synthase